MNWFDIAISDDCLKIGQDIIVLFFLLRHAISRFFPDKYNIWEGQTLAVHLLLIMINIVVVVVAVVHSFTNFSHQFSLVVFQFIIIIIKLLEDEKSKKLKKLHRK